MRFALAALVTVLAHPVFADPQPDCGLGPWSMCRYLDDAGAPLTEAVFQRAEAFADGRAAVRIGGHWGYVDATGQLVIPARYQQAAAFRHGLAEVTDGPGIMVIDPTGATVTHLDARRAIPVSATTVMTYFDDPVLAAQFPGHPCPTELWRSPAEEQVFVYPTAQQFNLTNGAVPTPPLRRWLPIAGAHTTFWFQIAEPGPTWDLYDWGLMRDDGSWVIAPGIMDIAPLPGGPPSHCPRQKPRMTF